jgi:hypothetical protein
MSHTEPPTQPLPIPPGSGSPAQKDPNRKRRRTAITLGLVALPVVGSAFVLPAIAGAQPPTPTASAAVLPAALPAALPVQRAAADTSNSGTSDDVFVQAFLDAGYTADDAAALAKQWNNGLTAVQAKVKAGKYLEDGVALKASPLADPHAADGLSDDQLVDVFVNFGYDLVEGQTLAEHWNVDVTRAKVRAARELKAVGVLPFVEPQSEWASQGEEDSFGAFFKAGFDYDDAVALAKFWGLGQPADAKMKAGALLLRGQQLPTVPGVSAG